MLKILIVNYNNSKKEKGLGNRNPRGPEGLVSLHFPRPFCFFEVK